jgi:hypothetical protein
MKIDRNCECAIRLVHLGANCQVKLKSPLALRDDTASVNPNDPVTFRVLNWVENRPEPGISRQRELIRIIELMQNRKR